MMNTDEMLIAAKKNVIIARQDMPKWRKSALLAGTRLGGRYGLALALTVSAATYALSTDNSYANPQNGQVVSGGATISEAGDVTTIHQSSQNVQINWESFSVGAGQTTEFVQPNANAIALNRVTGSDPSNILGNLVANGRVFLINPNGVIFGEGARVDVSSLAVSTANIGVDDFDAQALEGRFTFNIPSDKLDASIVNDGDVTVAETGFAVFVAPHVQNRGLVVANLGKIELGGAQTFTLDLHGDNLVTLDLGADAQALAEEMVALVDNQGSLQANGGLVALRAKNLGNVIKRVINTEGLIEANTISKKDGKVILSAVGAGTSVIAGTISASGSDTGDQGGTISIDSDRSIVTGNLVATGKGSDGGNIDVTGREVLLLGADIDVSGRDGGRARIGGEFQGGRDLAVDEIRNADNVLIDDQTVVRADGGAGIAEGDTGEGGEIIVWSELVTDFFGLLSSVAGSEDGKGGLIEVSSHEDLGFHGDLNIRNGQVLLDPTDIEITNAAASSNFDSSDVTDVGEGQFVYDFGDDSIAGDPDQINPTDIIALLNSGTSLELRANKSITVTNGITTTAAGHLVLKAGESIAINDSISMTNSALSLFLNDAGADSSRGTDIASLTMAAGTSITVANDFTATMGTNAAGGGNAVFGAITSQSGNITIDMSNANTGSSMTFNGDLSAQRVISVTGVGNASFAGAISAAFDDIIINTSAAAAGSTTSFDGALTADRLIAVDTAGAITFTGAVDSSENVDITGKGDITFASTVDADNGEAGVLNVATTGKVAFQGAVTAVDRVLVKATGGIELDANMRASFGSIFLVADSSVSDADAIARNVTASTSMGDILSTTTNISTFTANQGEIFLAGNNIGDQLGNGNETGRWIATQRTTVHAATDAKLNYTGVQEVALSNEFGSAGLFFDVGNTAAFTAGVSSLLSSGSATDIELGLFSASGDIRWTVATVEGSPLTATGNLTLKHVANDGLRNSLFDFTNDNIQVGGAVLFATDTSEASGGRFGDVQFNQNSALTIGATGQAVTSAGVLDIVSSEAVTVNGDFTLGGRFFLDVSGNAPISVNGNIATDSSFSAVGGGTAVFGAVTSTSGAITIDLKNALVGSSMTFNGALSANNNITIDGVGNATFAGSLTSSIGDVTINTANATAGSVTSFAGGLSADRLISVNTAGGITFTGAVNSREFVDIDAKGDILFSGTVDATNGEAGDLNVSTTGKVSFNGAVNAVDRILVKATGGIELDANLRSSFGSIFLVADNSVSDADAIARNVTASTSMGDILSTTTNIATFTANQGEIFVAGDNIGDKIGNSNETGQWVATTRTTIHAATDAKLTHTSVDGEAFVSNQFGTSGLSFDVGGTAAFTAGVDSRVATGSAGSIELGLFGNSGTRTWSMASAANSPLTTTGNLTLKHVGTSGTGNSSFNFTTDGEGVQVGGTVLFATDTSQGSGGSFGDIQFSQSSALTIGTVGQSVTTAGLLRIISSNSVTLNSNFDLGGLFSVDSSGSSTLITVNGDISANSSFSIDNNAGITVNGNIAGQSVTLFAGSGITLSGNANATSTDVRLTASDFIDITGNLTANDDIVVSTQGLSTIPGKTVALDITGVLQARDFMGITSSEGGVSIAGDLQTTVSGAIEVISFNGDLAFTGKADSASDISIVAGLTSGGEVSPAIVGDTSNIAVDAEILASGFVLIVSQQDVSVANSARGREIQLVGQNVSVSADLTITEPSILGGIIIGDRPTDGQAIVSRELGVPEVEIQNSIAPIELDSTDSNILIAATGSVSIDGNATFTAQPVTNSELGTVGDRGFLLVHASSGISVDGLTTDVGDILFDTGGDIAITDANIVSSKSTEFVTGTGGDISITGALTAENRAFFFADTVDVSPSGALTVAGLTGVDVWDNSFVHPGGTSCASLCSLESQLAVLTGSQSPTELVTPLSDDTNFVLNNFLKDGTFVGVVPDTGTDVDDIPDNILDLDTPDFDDPDLGGDGFFDIEDGSGDIADDDAGLDDGDPGDEGDAVDGNDPGNVPVDSGTSPGNDGPPPAELTDQNVLSGGDPLLSDSGAGDAAAAAATELSTETPSDSQLSDNAAATGDAGVVETTSGVLDILGDDVGGGDTGGNTPQPPADPGDAFGGQSTTLVPGLVEFDPTEVASTGPGPAQTPAQAPAGGAGNTPAANGDSGGGSVGNAGGGNAGGDSGGAPGAGSAGPGGDAPAADTTAGGDTAASEAAPASDAASAPAEDNAAANNDDNGTGDGDGDGEGNGEAEGDGSANGGDGEGGADGSSSVGVAATGVPGVGGLDGVSADGELPAPFGSLGLF